MVQPYNYIIDTPDPTAKLMQGFGIGRGLRAEEEQRQQQLAQQERQAAFQAELAQLSDNPSSQEIGKFMLRNLDYAEKLKEPFKIFSEAEQRAHADQLSSIDSALQSGNLEVTKSLIAQYAEAARNSGKEQNAKIFEDAGKIIDLDPGAAKKIIGVLTSIAVGPEKYAKIGEERRKGELHPVEIKKIAAELGLTNAQSNEVLARTKKLGAETQKIALELESLQLTGGIEPEKAFEQEEKLRKEFQNRTKLYQEVNQTYENLKASASAATGPGDVALITGFMKMLDPGSVVRETEFATARDTAGLYASLRNALEKAKGGQFLQPGQRQHFLGLAEKYYEAAQKKANQDKRDLGIVARNYRLNPDNIFGDQRLDEKVDAEDGKGNARPGSPGVVRITLPNGQTASFKNQQAADEFRRAAGLQ